MLPPRLLLLTLCGALTAGCTSLPEPSLRTGVHAAGSRHATMKARPTRSVARHEDVTRAAGRTSRAGAASTEPAVAAVQDDGWLAGIRRRMAQASQDIAADLDFHESEGLEAFAPDALEQVNMLRGDMNGAADITR